MVDAETAAARLAAHLTARRAEREKFPPQVRGDGAVNAMAGLFAGFKAPISEDDLWALLDERAALRALAPQDRSAIGDDEEFFVPGHVYLSANGWWRFECAAVAAGVALGRELCLKDRAKPGFTRSQVWKSVKPAGSWRDVTEPPAPGAGAASADQVVAQPAHSAASNPQPASVPAAVNRHADLAGLLAAARALQTPVPDKARVGRAMREGTLTADDVRWVYEAAAFVKHVVTELEPGALTSPADLPDERPLFTTRRLFAAVEKRLAHIEDALGLADDAEVHHDVHETWTPEDTIGVQVSLGGNLVSTVTAVEFDTEPYGGPQPGAQRLTAPHSGRYSVDKQLPYRADPGGIMEFQMTQTAPRLLFDPDALRAAVGERIALQGPHAIRGILRSVDAADDGLSVTLRVEVEHAAASAGMEAEAGDG